MPNSTLLILASARDRISRRLAALWQSAGARLLLPRDLSRPGWRFEPGRISGSIAVADGDHIPANTISGVLTRLPSVMEDELVEIAPTDRLYVAQEMNAFLTAWLSALPCPVLNRPGPVSLCGPNWRPEQWTHAAARCGVPVSPVQRRIPPSTGSALPPPATAVTVTVVGRQAFGASDRTLRAHARKIADTANVGLVAIQFSESNGSFLSANLWPDLSTPELAEAVCHQLGAASHRRSAQMSPAEFS